MEWKTNQEKQIHKRGAENVYKNEPGLRLAAKSVKNPSPSFKLFFVDKMMDNIAQYTNKKMQPVKDRVMLNLLIKLMLNLSLAFCI